MTSELEEKLVTALKSKGAHISFAESCTSGLLAAGLVNVSGASEVFEASFVTYSNAQKCKVLGVKEESIEAYTEVSGIVAEQMAKGAKEKAGAEYALSTTGYAGPTGGTKENPVGTVYIGVATPESVKSYRYVFPGSREEVRNAAVEKAYQLLLEAFA
ncbi:MAG: CinA family protein [Lachnospiraceae bacterium]|nr:CinA family protein [Lachnospiraceae bacterium]